MVNVWNLTAMDNSVEARAHIQEEVVALDRSTPINEQESIPWLHAEASSGSVLQSRIMGGGDD